jgi:ribonuclease HIII
MNDAKVDNITTDIMAIIENSSVTLSEDQYKNVLTADYQAAWLENDRV